MGACFELWCQWAREEYGHNLDVQGWWAGAIPLYQQENFVPIIAWDGLVPVGMVEYYDMYDACRRAKMGHGDHAFVVKSHRGSRVFEALYDAIIDVAAERGCEELCAPVGVGGKADFLKGFYEKQGFEVRGHIMRKKG